MKRVGVEQMDGQVFEAAGEEAAAEPPAAASRLRRLRARVTIVSSFFEAAAGVPAASVIIPYLSS